MLLQATLNGPYSTRCHQAVPVSAAELAFDARICVAEGAGAIHVHPRDANGVERLETEVVDGVVAVVKDACGVPVGVSAGAWIEPDLDLRITLIRTWRAVDYAVVDFGEPGAAEVARACLEAGIAVEAGVTCATDVETLAASGLGGLILRVLVGPVGGPADALAAAQRIHDALDWHEVPAPRMQFGRGHAAWTLLGDAIRRGFASRIGLEDTIREPGGNAAVGNGALIRAAARLR